MIHAALTPFTPPTAAHVVALAAVIPFVHVCGSDAESMGTQMDKLVLVRISEQLTQVFAAEMDPLAGGPRYKLVHGFDLRAVIPCGGHIGLLARRGGGGR